MRTTRNTGWDALGAFEAVRGHALNCEYRYLRGGGSPAGSWPFCDDERHCLESEVVDDEDVDGGQAPDFSADGVV